MNAGKRKATMSMEVNEAVNDILNGTSVDSHTQWLQREYIRLLRRECNRERQILVNESNLEINKRDAGTETLENANE